MYLDGALISDPTVLAHEAARDVRRHDVGHSNSSIDEIESGLTPIEKGHRFRLKHNSTIRRRSPILKAAR